MAEDVKRKLVKFSPGMLKRIEWAGELEHRDAQKEIIHMCDTYLLRDDARLKELEQHQGDI